MRKVLIGVAMLSYGSCCVYSATANSSAGQFLFVGGAWKSNTGDAMTSSELCSHLCCVNRIYGEFAAINEAGRMIAVSGCILCECDTNNYSHSYRGHLGYGIENELARYLRINALSSGAEDTLSLDDMSMRIANILFATQKATHTAALQGLDLSFSSKTPNCVDISIGNAPIMLFPTSTCCPTENAWHDLASKAASAYLMSNYVAKISLRLKIIGGIISISDCSTFPPQKEDK